MCCKSRGGLSRLGVIWGLFALAALVIAFISGSWLYTREPVTLPNSQITTSITFKIGLWRVCPSVKRGNFSTHVPPIGCTVVKYAGWEDITQTDLGVWTALELAPPFITRMRSCTILSGIAAIFLLLAVFFALLGHCNSDNKTIIACGLFILAGLSLGTGLVVFASTLSETLLEITQYHKSSFIDTPLYEYRYGWCFFTAGIAFIMTKMAAVFSLSGYLNRFPSVDEMVREMVPGAERKLREHQRLSSEYLVRHTGPPRGSAYDPIVTDRPKYEAELGPLLNKTPPDVCTTNKCMEFAAADLNSGGGAGSFSGVIEQNYSSGNTLAGQTIPITIKNHNCSAPLSFSNLPVNKYGTMPHPGTTIHHGFLGVSEIGSSSSNSSSGHCAKSKTLQHQKPRKKSVKIETFQTPDTGFAEFSGKRTNTLSYSGSAV